ncbi:ubiquitin carboxyl-terminal hydrolase 26-like [Cyprinodon tularosa]|uniref:ubiquitin carboxyl-terminal hydrolase 26-like n=1 Tax=Cyprinodon tularosa TaxID=77115 RepID=UPI0018E28BA5|nr:ubiquitin carboxyl-terminal hydrolase 26-like [Cyprinodon tularosa]
MPTEREATYYGLINQGATCYLNSILQVLFRTKEFKEAVNRSEEVKDHYIDRHLKDLFKNLQDKKTNARKIIEALGIKREYEQQDAAEYFEKILRLTSDDAAKTFRGQLSHRTTCCKCHNVNDSFGHFWHLPLELLNSRGIYSVENGINDFFKPTVFNGENQMYCDNCDEKVDAHRQYVITHHPDVLLLLLKRFDFSYQYMSYVKINCSVEFPYQIKIPEKQIYELYSVVEHVGDLRSGHYWATIKSQEEENLWYTFNDTNVSQIVPNKCPGNDNIAKSSSAYLLFYRKKGTEEKVENSVFQPPGMETNINKHERVKSNATRSTTDKDFAVSKVSTTQTDNLPDPTGNISEDNGNIMVYQHEEHNRDNNLLEHKDRNRGTTDQASHERKKQNTAHFQPEQSQNLVMPVDDLNVSQRPYEENIGKNKNIDGTEKHQTENSHVECTTVRNPNTAEQGESFLPPNYQIQQNKDKNTNKSINIQANSNGVVKPDERKTDPTYNQPETTHANLNKNKQTREREEHINQLLSVASDHVPQSDQRRKSKQTDLKDQALAAEHLQMSDKRSRKATSKANEEKQVDATKAGCQHKHDHIDCSSINKGQTQNNGNTNGDYNSGVIQARKTQPMIQSTRDKCTLDKKRNTKEDDGTMKKDGLKTHAKGQESNEDTDDSPRQSGSRNEERQAGKQVAEGNVEISTANTSKGLKGNHKMIFKIIEERTETIISYKGISRETSVKEISQGILTKKEENSVGHQINEEQGQLMVDENQKHTTRLAKKF